MIADRDTTNLYGELHHAKENDGRRQKVSEWDYEAAPRRKESRQIWGHSQVAAYSEREARAARDALERYGNNYDNLPRASRGQSCQSWAAGALGSLEGQSLAPRGTGEYYAQFYHRPGEEIRQRITEDGRAFRLNDQYQGTTMYSLMQDPRDASRGRQQQSQTDADFVVRKPGGTRSFGGR